MDGPRDRLTSYSEKLEAPRQLATGRLPSQGVYFLPAYLLTVDGCQQHSIDKAVGWVGLCSRVGSAHSLLRPTDWSIHDNVQNATTILLLCVTQTDALFGLGPARVKISHGQMWRSALAKLGVANKMTGYPQKDGNPHH